MMLLVVKMYFCGDEECWSIAGEVFVALVDGLDVFLLLFGSLLLEENLLHISTPLGGLTGWLVALFLLLTLFFELQFLRLLFLANLVLPLLVLFDLLLNFCNQMRMQLLFTLYGGP